MLTTAWEKYSVPSQLQPGVDYLIGGMLDVNADHYALVSGRQGSGGQERYITDLREKLGSTSRIIIDLQCLYKDLGVLTITCGEYAFGEYSYQIEYTGNVRPSDVFIFERWANILCNEDDFMYQEPLVLC